MFKNLKLATKIGIGFSVLILIAGVLGFVGWSGVHSIRAHMNEYALWGDIDMVMNEGVTQTILKLINNLNVYQTDPGPETLKRLKKAISDVEEGLNEWKGLVTPYPALNKVAKNTEINLNCVENSAEQFAALNIKASRLQKQWDELVATILSSLETTMEKVIDPAKETAEKNADISTMIKWGSIDMVMNEAVIANVLKLQTAAHDYTAKSTNANWEQFQNRFTIAREGLTEWIDTLGDNVQMNQAATKVKSYLDEYQALSKTYNEKIKKKIELKNKTSLAFENLLIALEKAMIKVIDPAKSEKVASAISVQNRSSILAIIFTVVGLVSGLIIAVATTLSITRPINQIISNLTLGADQVKSASTQISGSSQQLASESSEQAASIEETSSSLEEMSSMTKQNADNARQVDTLMKDANRVVTKANDSMENLTKAMQDISKASEETQKIVKTIDEIAFQTNLLALNAAVEAARAGEVGAGFAVVADEVRNLALRAADAAKNTSDLIEETVKKIKEGTSLVDTTNEAFTEVFTNTKKIGNLIAEISSASSEQALGLEQVNNAISTMDKVVQSNAANAEESASASEELNAQCTAAFQTIERLNILVTGKGFNSSEKKHILTNTVLCQNH